MAPRLPARRALPLLALAALVALSGCREDLVGPDPVTSPSPTAPEVSTMYLKGPAVLRIGEMVEYRGEPFPNASYVWSTDGGAAFYSPDRSSSRVFRLRGDRPGNLEVTMAAFRDGGLLAQTRRVIEVR